MRNIAQLRFQNGRSNTKHHLSLRSDGSTCPTYPSSTGFRVFSTPGTDTFQLSLAVLVRYRSRRMFRIGGSWPPSSARISNRAYSGCSVAASRGSQTGLSPSTALRSSRVMLPRLGETRVHTPHPQVLVAQGFGLSCSVFSRPYSRN